MSLHTATFSTSFRSSLFLSILISNLSRSPKAFQIAQRNSFRSFCLPIHDTVAFQNDGDLSNNRKSPFYIFIIILYLLFIMSFEVVWEFTIWFLLTGQVTN